MHISTFKPLKASLLQLKCIFIFQIHSIQALFNSMCHCNLKLLKISALRLNSSIIQLKCTFAHPIQLSTLLWFKYAFAHQVRPISTHMCHCTLKSLKTNPLQLKCAFALPINPDEAFSTHMCHCTYAFPLIKSCLLTLKCAFALPIHLHQALFNSNVPLDFQEI